MSGILRLESLTKGNTLKQGDKTALKYRLFDADGEQLNIAGKSATVRLVYPDFLTIGYEKDGLTVAQDDTVTFTIDSVIPSRIYHVEIIVDDQFIFPSRADESKFTVDKSTLGTETNIIEIIGKDILIRDVKQRVEDELQPLVTSLESAEQAESQRVIAESDRAIAESQRNTDHANRIAEIAGKADKVILENMVDPTNDSLWKALYGSYDFQNGEHIYTVVDPNGASRIEYTSPPITIGNLYYANFEIKPIFSERTYFRVGLAWNEEQHPTPGEWSTLSSIVTANSDERRFRFYHHTAENYNEGDEVRYRNISVINLTETFGAGNEPTKEEMDELVKVIGYIDGEYALNNKDMFGYLLNGIGEVAEPKDKSVTTRKLADGAVGYPQTNFIDYEVLSSNYFNKENAILDTFLDPNGRVPLASYFASGIIQSPEASSWTIFPCRYVNIYDDNKELLSSENTGSNSATKVIEVPAGGWFEFAGPMSLLDSAQLNKGTELESFEEYKNPIVSFPELTFTDIQKNELLAQIDGGDIGNVEPADGSVTTAKLADKAITPDKTSFVYLDPRNLANPETMTEGIYFSTSGAEANNDLYMSTDFIPVTVGGYTLGTPNVLDNVPKVARVPFYDQDKNFVSLVSNGISASSNTAIIDIPSDGYIRVSVRNEYAHNLVVASVENYDGYHDYAYTSDIRSQPPSASVGRDELIDKSVTIDKTNFIGYELVSSNYFDKSTAKIDIFLSSGSYSDFVGYFTSQLITSEDASTWTIYPCRAVKVFDSFGNQILFENTGSNSATLAIDVPAGGSFEFSGHMSYIDEAQVNKGDILLEYEPFRSPAPFFPELEFTQEQKDKLLGSTVIPNPNPTTETGGLEVTRNGSTIKVQSESDGHVLVNNLSLTGSANGAFNISSTALDNQTIHSVSDDITPIRTFYTVGANHGYPSQRVTISGHGKTIADLGSIWTDGETDFTLLRVDGDALTFISEYVVLSNGAHTHKSGFSGSTLTHKSGATNTSQLESVSASGVQLYPVIKDIHQELNIPSEDGKYNVDEFIVRESYEILDYMALVDWCQSNIGKYYEDNLEEIEAVAKYSTTYTYQNFGKCLVNNSLLYYKKSRTNNTGFLQSGRLNASAIRYMPDIKPISGFDFKQGVQLDSYTSSLSVLDDDLIDVEYPPTRYVDSHENYGYTMGYVPDKMGAIPNVRKSNTTQYWDLRNTGKSYPVAFSGTVGIAEPGDYYAIEGYRNYFIKDPDLTLFDEVEDGEAYYVFIDAHKSIPYLTRNVSAKEGSKIEVIRQDGIELLNDYVSSEGIALKVPEDYGQMVLKIYK